MRLHIISWNLHGVPFVAPRRQRRMQLAAERLRGLTPAADVILLQEIFFPADLEVVQEHLGDDYRLIDGVPQRAFPPWFLPLLNLGGIFMRFRQSGLATFVHRRWEVTGSRFEAYRVADWEVKVWDGEGYAGKGFQQIDLRDTDGGSRVTVFNTHTQSRRRKHEIRKHQIGQLAAAACGVDRDVPVIIAGDLNVRPEEPLYITMTKDFGWLDLTDDVAKCGERLGYVEKPRERIGWRRDYVFALASSRWRFESRGEFICNLAQDVPYSDHHGLAAQLDIHPAVNLIEPMSASRMHAPAAALALLAAAALHGPSTRRAWLLGLVALPFSWRETLINLNRKIPRAANERE